MELTLWAEDGGVFEDNVEDWVTSVSVALAICSAMWCLRKKQAQRVVSGGGVLKLEFQEGWGGRLKNQQQKIFYGVGVWICFGTTKPMMNYAPEVYFYSLSTNQTLHDQETEKVDLFTMFRVNEFLKMGFQYRLTKTGLCRLTNKKFYRCTCRYLASAVKSNVPCTPGTHGRAPSSWSDGTLVSSELKWLLCTITCCLKQK